MVHKAFSNRCTEGDGFQFTGAVSGTAVVTIGRVDDENAVASGETGISVLSGIAGNANVGVEFSDIDSTGDGVLVQGLLGTADLTLGTGNDVNAGGVAVNVTNLQSPTTLRFTGGSYTGSTNALLVDNTSLSAGTAGSVVFSGSPSFAVTDAAGTVASFLTNGVGPGIAITYGGTPSFDGGTHRIVMSGTGISTVGDTLGSTTLTGQTDRYVSLVNGAEFAPGSPSVLDATAAMFDALNPTLLADAITLEGKLTHYLDSAADGLFRTGSTVGVTSGTSIQLAINAAEIAAAATNSFPIATIAVGSGTFGGNVEAWVDNLRISGVDTGGGAPIIDLNGLDPFSNNPGLTRHGFLVGDFGVIGDPADGTGGPGSAATPGFGSSLNGNDVTGVMIDSFVFTGLGFAGSTTGVVLGQNAIPSLSPASTAIGATVEDNTFEHLDNSVVGAIVAGTTTLEDNTMRRILLNGIVLPELSGVAVNVLGNDIQAGSDVIRFSGSVTDSTVTVSLNLVTATGASGNGIRIESTVDGDSDFDIVHNQIGTVTPIAMDGVVFESGILGTATVTLGGTNQIVASGQAIEVNDLQSPSTLSIRAGTYEGSAGALLVDNTGVAGTDGRLEISAAAFVGGAGSTVFEVLTDAGNAGVDIDFSGAGTLDGGAAGMRLSGPGIDILNDTLGNIAFTNQATNYIELANAAEFLLISPTPIDATSTSFDGKLGSAMTPTELQAVEDMITHFPDDNTLGVIDIATLFVIPGESIQKAINGAALLGGPQTVTVASGKFGGSVEVWVDDLTLVGQGATTIIDTDAVVPFANNGDIDTGFLVAAVDVATPPSQAPGGDPSGTGDVSSVTIDGFTFDSVATSGTHSGIELGVAGVSEVSGTTLQNNDFDDLANGIVADAITGTTMISNASMTSIAERGILFQPILLGDDVILIDASSIASVGDAVRFVGGLTGADVTVAGSILTSTTGDGIHFASPISDATIAIGGASPADGNSIQAGNNGIDFNVVSGNSSAQVAQTDIGLPGNPVGGDGIRVTGLLDTAELTLGTGNDINAAGVAVNVFNLQSPSTLSITDGSYTGANITLSVDNTTQPGGTAGGVDLSGAASFSVTNAGGTVAQLLTDAVGPGLNLDFRTSQPSFTGGLIGILFSGIGIDIVEDTLGNIAFGNQTDSFITLADGAEFAPGGPTLIDVIGVDFDGLSATRAADIPSLEEKLFHFVDDASLGLIGRGALGFVDSSHELRILGTDEQDRIRVRQNSRQEIVVANFGGALRERIVFDRGDVVTINIDVLDGDDDVRLAGNVEIPATIFGDHGEDMLIGGAANDLIDGGNDNDLLRSGRGDDTIIDVLGDNRAFGDAGNDHITTGDGIDTIRGGSGDDMVRSGDGNDIVNGGGGGDII